MNVTWPRCTSMCIFAAIALLFMPVALAQAPDTNAALERRVSELEKTQQRQLDEMRKERLVADGAPVTGDEEHARLRKLIEKVGREIEKRVAAQGEAALYFTSSTAATAEMSAYYKRLVARLEDCGMRHMPKRDEKSVYGKGVVSIELDHGGNVVDMEIEQSSSDELIDNHMLKLIAASTPFGPTPERVRPEDERRYKRLVVITGFEFMHGTNRPARIHASERCKL